ncbi:hypothetical protein BJX70DRAFT_361044 [Aspergillus crustosus]
MMFNTAAARRTSSALSRNLRTPTLSSRSFTFSSQPRPLQHIQHITKSNPASPYSHLRISPSISLRQSLNLPQSRNLTYSQRARINFKRAAKKLIRTSPVTVALFVVALAALIVANGYMIYVEYKRTRSTFQKYPETVLKHLRPAIHYTDVDLQPQLALKAYRQALGAALQEGMHQFSDEVLGIKLKVAVMLEDAGLVEEAVQVYERTCEEMLKWVAAGRKQAAQSVKPEAPQIKQQETTPVETTEVNDTQDLEALEEAKRLEAWEDVQRNKVIKKAVGMKVKLGMLYDSDYIQDDKKAEAAYESAVELSLKELQYREGLGLPVTSGDEQYYRLGYVTRMETAVALIGLADKYLRSQGPTTELAIPLYLRALDFVSSEEGSNRTCKQAQIMTNLASAMGVRAQQPFRVKNAEAVRTQIFNAATQWASKALKSHDSLPDSEKEDETCQMSRFLALKNLAGFAESQGRLEDARVRFTDLLSVLNQSPARKGDPQFDEIFAQAEESLKRMSK